MDDRKYYDERRNPDLTPTSLTFGDLVKFLGPPVRVAWTEVLNARTQPFVALELRTKIGLEYRPDMGSPIPGIDDAKYFSLLEFTWDRLNSSQRFKFVKFVNAALAHYGDGYRFDRDGNIISTGTAGLSEPLERKAPVTETEANRKRLDEAVYLFRRAGSTRQDKKDAIDRLGEIIEWHKKDFDKVVPRREKDRLGEFLNGFSIRHHDEKQEEDYPDAWLEWMFVRALATVHLYWDLKAKESGG